MTLGELAAVLGLSLDAARAELARLELDDATVQALGNGTLSADDAVKIAQRNRGLPTKHVTLVPSDEFRAIIEQLPPDVAREARNMTRDEFLAFITDPFWAEIAVQPQAAYGGA